jgi:hypothetical protein
MSPFKSALILDRSLLPGTDQFLMMTQFGQLDGVRRSDLSGTPKEVVLCYPRSCSQPLHLFDGDCSERPVYHLNLLLLDLCFARGKGGRPATWSINLAWSELDLNWISG